MAQQTIGIGTAPNDGTGDALRTMGGKANDNFTELYGAVSAKASSSDARLRPVGAFSAHKNGVDQTGVAASTYVKVTFGTADVNAGSVFASSTFTPPAGIVSISAQLYVTGVFGAGTLKTAALFKNGIIFKEGFVYSTGINSAVIPFNVIVGASGSDAFDIRVYGTTTSGTLTVMGDSKYTFFAGAMI